MPISAITTNDTIGLLVTRTSQLITAYNTLEANGAINSSITAQTAFGVANAAFQAANVANNLTVANTGNIIGSRNILNFIPGGNVSITFTDDVVGNRINVGISAIVSNTFLTMLTRDGNIINVAVTAI